MGDDISEDAAVQRTGDDERAARSRLRTALAPRATVQQLVIGLLFVALGFAGVAATQSSSASGLLATAREDEVVRVLDDLTERQARLQAEQRALEAARDRLLSGSEEQRLAASRARADVLAILAGTVPATGTGIRITLQECARLLHDGHDYARSGVLERRMDDAREPPGANVWTRPADAAHKRAAGLRDDDHAWWHEAAGWVRPASLVRAWLGHPHITWRGGERITSIDELRAQADLVVVAAAHGSMALLGGALHLNSVRGQATWGANDERTQAPPFAVNGNGHLLPRVAIDGVDCWITGATYGRGETDTSLRAEDDAANLERLRTLLPAFAAQVAPTFAEGRTHSWAGVRCVANDRRPLVGPVADGVWVSTGMGSRGLSFAAMCGELLAARLHAEPLPLAPALADALAVERAISKGNEPAGRAGTA